MRHIAVDFNTITSAPEGVVKFHIVDPVTGESYETLALGDHVKLYEDEATTALTVEAILTERWQELWLATPDAATWKDVPMVKDGHIEQRPKSHRNRHDDAR